MSANISLASWLSSAARGDSSQHLLSPVLSSNVQMEEREICCGPASLARCFIDAAPTALSTHRASHLARHPGDSPPARGAADGASGILHGRPLQFAICLGPPSLISNHHRLASLQLGGKAEVGVGLATVVNLRYTNDPVANFLHSRIDAWGVAPPISRFGHACNKILNRYHSRHFV